MSDDDSDHADHDHHPHDHADHGHGDHGGAAEDERVTAPMQAFSTSQVGTGVLVLVVGLVVAFGLPLLLV